MNRQSNIKKQLRLTKRDSSLIREVLNIPKPNALKKSSSMNQLNAINQLVLATFNQTFLKHNPSNRQEWRKHLKPLDFAKYHLHHDQPLSRTCYRYFIRESHLAFIDSLSLIIKIQSNYRSYTSKKLFYVKAKDYMKAKGINALVIIQSKVRQFLLLKRYKRRLLIGSILAQRKENFRKIEQKMQRFYNRNRDNKELIYSDIVKKRTRSALKLQSVFRQKVAYFNVLALKEKMRTSYFFSYPFKAKEISLKVFVYDNESLNYKVNIYDFAYNSFLRSFVLFVPHDAISSGKYRCQFLVDGTETCDGRYPHLEFSDGLFYNMIDFTKSNELTITDQIQTTESICDFDETRTDEMHQLEVDLGYLSSKCFFEGMKNLQSNEDFLSLKIDLFGKKFNSKMDEIKQEPFSTIELKFDNY